MPDLPSHSAETRNGNARGNSVMRLFNPKILFRRRLVLFVFFCTVCMLLLYHTGVVNPDRFSFHRSENALVDQDETLTGSVSNSSFPNEQSKLENPANTYYLSAEHKKLSLGRQAKVRAALLSTWGAYFSNAFGQDEIVPLTKEGKLSHNGWGVTVVDSLDTLLILSSQYDYIQGKQHVKNMTFSHGTVVPYFETTSRYIGGFLGAYELMQDAIMLEKATELGDLLAQAFESPSGIPYSSLDFITGEATTAAHTEGSLLGEIGGLQMEFRRLAQVTGKRHFLEKSQYVIDFLDQSVTKIPGLYPQAFDPDSGKFKSQVVSLENTGHRFYETLLKQYLFSVNTLEQYRVMYERAADAIHKHLIYVDSEKRTFLASLDEDGKMVQSMNHEACAVPGMLALGAQALNRPDDLLLAKALIQTCIGMAETTTTGLPPSRIGWAAKDQYNELSSQHKNEIQRHGFYTIEKDYQLWPEIVESLFMLYRVTLDRQYQEAGWKFFLALEKHCKVKYGFSGLKDVGNGESKDNHMDSQFLAKTMKYLYLLFTPTDLLPIDEYLFTSGGHVIRIPRKWESRITA
ncbi:seven-hairpin glycosidase [Basidiobolus meristosporus CBS 931.73]|uniref:alpha-1,2-Mannosidase n=1 Tax=Basidiobolus meristosporus CBS 931.73 TaxID=1314790 RepID=A0A1Y1YKB4_9FUNG|nr:seven-hairpin glycosidase [Basidiobolus meristosporus CBS 931.73]|eukprot:ORX98196.1 seven-hairpin glycosidase [Basidiobolus meristosporus CBS 931.73]